MFIVFSVAALCLVILIVALLGVACRSPECKSLWIVSDDAILCFVSPVIIAIFCFACLSLGWRLTHGGFGAVSLEGWIGTAVVIAVSAALWFTFVARIRNYRRPAGSGAAR